MGKPIIFNTEMVQAILDGRKTQTRRVIKPQPPVDTFEDDVALLGYFTLSSGEQVGYGFCDAEGKEYKCPYGNPGDELWVRETWADNIPGCPNGISFRADHQNPMGDGPANPITWKPSIFMPRWASRIQLKITNVWVERLQDIADPQAEGVGYWGCDTIEVFEDLWDSINAKRGYSFASNPWVWCIEFERIK